ncbi:MAG: GTP cyclohydrolase II, partial [Longimicrobiales bacterium]
MYRAERALFELRQGRPIWIQDEVHSQSGSSSIIAPVETLADSCFNSLKQLCETDLKLIITASRAQALNILKTKATDLLSDGISLTLDSTCDINQLLHLSTGLGQEGSMPHEPAYRLETEALSLLRLLRLIPAAISCRITADHYKSAEDFVKTFDILSTTAKEISELTDTVNSSISRISEANVPLRNVTGARFILFRESNTLFEHLAVLVGEPLQTGDPVSVRLHSACLTGDLFNSLKCDCGEQLHKSLDYFTQNNGGVFLYLNQEGRGIGLGNKLRAYQLQDELGLDTIDADCALGFRSDERDYGVGMKMLNNLGVDRINILTNNPDKVGWAEKAGLEVASRVPLFGKPNPHN